MNTIVMSSIAGVTTCCLLFFRRKKYDISYIELIALLIVLGVLGYLGAACASYLSYDSWTGIRFYGKTLFVTISLYVVSLILKKNLWEIMDYYAPVDIFALTIMKINCLRAGCCSGIVLFYNDAGENIVFPSQTVELALALVLFLFVMLAERKLLFEGYRYSIYLLVYGSTRFFLNYLRENPGNSIYFGTGSFNITNLFCVIIVFLGIIGVYLKRKNINLQRFKCNTTINK